MVGRSPFPSRPPEITTFFDTVTIRLTTAPAGAVARPAREARTVAARIDIEREAARLQAHAHQDLHYTEPSRNPFRFSERRQVQGTSSPAVAAPSVPITPPAPLPPRITLDGIAADTMGEQPQRTAILNTDAGVVLAKEGDQVAGYRVEKIAADAVELVKIDDGSVLRVGLR
jgi:hypothetical protein